MTSHLPVALHIVLLLLLSATIIADNNDISSDNDDDALSQAYPRCSSPPIRYDVQSNVLVIPLTSTQSFNDVNIWCLTYVICNDSSSNNNNVEMSMNEATTSCGLSETMMPEHSFTLNVKRANDSVAVFEEPINPSTLLAGSLLQMIVGMEFPILVDLVLSIPSATPHNSFTLLFAIDIAQGDPLRPKVSAPVVKLVTPAVFIANAPATISFTSLPMKASSLSDCVILFLLASDADDLSCSARGWETFHNQTNPPTNLIPTSATSFDTTFTFPEVGTYRLCFGSISLSGTAMVRVASVIVFGVNPSYYILPTSVTPNMPTLLGIFGSGLNPTLDVAKIVNARDSCRTGLSSANVEVNSGLRGVPEWTMNTDSVTWQLTYIVVSSTDYRYCYKFADATDFVEMQDGSMVSAANRPVNSVIPPMDNESMLMPPSCATLNSDAELINEVTPSPSLSVELSSLPSSATPIFDWIRSLEELLCIPPGSATFLDTNGLVGPLLYSLSIDTVDGTGAQKVNELFNSFRHNSSELQQLLAIVSMQEIASSSMDVSPQQQTNCSWLETYSAVFYVLIITGAVSVLLVAAACLFRRQRCVKAEQSSSAPIKALAVAEARESYFGEEASVQGRIVGATASKSEEEAVTLGYSTISVCMGELQNGT